MITILSLENISEYEEAIKSFFRSVPFGRYLSDRKLDKNRSINFEFDSLVRYIKHGNLIIKLKNKNEVLGLVGFHLSDWDTVIFKKRMAILQYFITVENKLNFDKIVANQLLNIFHDWASKNKIDVVITKIDTKYFAPILVLQEHGYIFYETITFRSIEVQNLKRAYYGNEFRFAVESDKEDLKKLALKNTFKKSHFYLDSNFELARVEEMYSNWIMNALSSSQKILVMEVDSKIVGVFIYENIDLSSYFSKKFGIWKFAAVDGSFRDKGLGMNLFKAAINACIIDSNDIIDTSLVEKNIISQNFHDKLGFQLVNTLYTFHKWFD